MSSTIPKSCAAVTCSTSPAGSGLVAIAAAKAGAASVVAADIDPFSAAAVAINAAANGVDARTHTSADLIGADHGWDVVLAGDVFYDRALAAGSCPGSTRWPAAARACSSATPAGPICRRQRLEPLAVYQIAVTRALEDAEVKRTTVWRFA